MGRLLQVGVLLASVVVLCGGVLYLHTSGAHAVNYRTFHVETSALRSPIGTIAGVRRGDPASIIQLGLLLLIATPVARVVFAVMAFAAQRDWLYVGIAATVLLVLVLSLTHVI